MLGRKLGEVTALERSCRRIRLRTFARLRNGRIDLIEPDGPGIAAPRGKPLRLPREHHDDLPRATRRRSSANSRSRRRGSGIASQTDMSAIWLNEIGAHYARTLELWRERFVANSDLAVQILFAKPERRIG